ncbi:MAG: S9 family peptidase, partial [Blastocatellia bacterium]|nr:S9 family peptidase [Blastocatellia bacterium]
MKTALEAVGIASQEAAGLSRQAFFNFNSSQTGAVINHSNDLYYYDFANQKAVRLTDSPADTETDETFSPDGSQIAFVRNYNIYVVDIKNRKERQLTHNGNKSLLNGRFDWIYEEEVYGRGVTTGYWWSPDSKEIAFLSLDQTGVPTFTVVDEIPRDQTIEVTNYPKPGDPNPKASLHVVNITDAAPKTIELDAYKNSEFLIVRVGWTPDSKQVVFEVQNREQNWLDLNLADLTTHKTKTLFREKSAQWVDIIGLPEWLADGSFLWLSDETGWRHIYHYNRDGQKIKAVTSGNWDVREIFGTSDDKWIYFSASQYSPISDHIYKVKLDGASLTRLSQEEGNHRASFNSSFTLFVNSRSNVMTPWQVKLRNNSGEVVRNIDENRVEALSEFQFSKPEFLKVKTRDGFEMEAVMIKPPNFDPNKKYPVMSHTYSGPGTPRVRDSWGGSDYLWHQMLAQNGYIIWICDNRSASNKGINSAHPVYKNLGELELRDLEDGINWLKQQSYVDAERIGLWGWSYGGYMTAYALTHSKLFKIGISGAPVTDWRSYDSIYTERYMGIPKNNPEGYKKSSVVEAAANLHGKLLLIHGTMDDNVHIQNSIQFVDALQRSGKRFELMLYPKSRHGVTQPLRVKHLRETMTKFILENL